MDKVVKIEGKKAMDESYDYNLSGGAEAQIYPRRR